MKLNIKFLLFLLCNLLTINTFGTEIPVLLRLSSSEQADTNGCNFVEQLTTIIYKEIIDGRLKLWDSPAKEIQITGITLAELEKNTNTQFLNQEIIYIYELWQNTHKALTSTTLGFNFSNKNSNGEDVAYGFVEYSAVRDLFMRTRINTNPNGDYSSTFAGYINNKTYNYNIIQFNGKIIKSVSESNKLKNEVIGNLLFNTATFIFTDPDRYILYQVEKNTNLTDERTQNSNKLIEAFESFLTENQEIFYNLGGDKILSYFQRNQLKVTRLEITEIWRKKEATISYYPKSMTIFVNDSALTSMNFKEMNKLEILINNKSLMEIINEKQFNFIITSINGQKIQRKDAFLYYKALMNSPWKRLTEYVKNY